MRLGLIALTAALLAGSLLAEEITRGPGGAAELTPGAEGIAITVISGRQAEEIPVKFLGTYHDFAGPGYDLHLVELQGPRAEEVGVAAGMSGSPVYFGGRLIGALAYRLGALPKRAVAGVTPIEDMLEVPHESGRSPAESTDTTIRPIATPVIATGLDPEVRGWFRPELEQLGFVMVSGGAGESDARLEPELRPGSPVGVQLVRGDLKMAATGTVTWVDEETVYAFGHPFLGSGPAEMPMVSAEVIHTLADLAGSLKLANIGSELGAIVDDRQSGIVGRLGATAAMIPMSLTVRGGDYAEQRYEFELVKNTNLAPLLAGLTVANTLRTNNGYSRESTMLATGRIELGGLPALPLEMAFATTGGNDPSFGVASKLLATLNGLSRNPFTTLDVERVDLEVDVSRDVRAYELDALTYDRGSLRPGQTLDVHCRLTKFRGGTESRTLSLELPDRLPRSGSLILAAGNPDDVDRALGGQARRKAETASDLTSLVRALADVRSAHRLTAVVYEPGGAVVSRGEAYTSLPPTAQRLLSTQNDTGGRRRSPLVTPLSRSETALDGPVSGIVQFRLRIERSEGLGETR